MINVVEDIVLGNSEFERGEGPQKFSYSKLEATNNFGDD